MNPGLYLFSSGLLISTIDTVYTLYCLVHPNTSAIHSGWSWKLLVSPLLLTPLWVKEHLKQPSPDSHSLQHILLSPWPTASSPLMGWDVPILVCLVLHIWQPGALIQAVSPFGLSPLCVPQLCDWLCRHYPCCPGLCLLSVLLPPSLPSLVELPGAGSDR